MISGNKNTKHVRNFWFRQTIDRIIIIIIIIMMIIIIIIMIMIRRRRSRRIKKVKGKTQPISLLNILSFCLLETNGIYLYVHSFVLSVWIHGFSFFFCFFFARRGCQGSIFSFTFLFFKVNLPIHITFCTS